MNTCAALTMVASVLVLSNGLVAQVHRPYTEWSEKDASKILNNSPWSYTEVFTGPPETGGSVRGAAPAGSRGPSTQNRPAVLDVSRINIRVRFLSAKPIRQALSRVMELRQGEISEAQRDLMRSFAMQDFPDSIIVTVSVDKNDSERLVQETMSLFANLTTGLLKNQTFLQTRGNQRLYLQEYQRPRNDDLGARFFFPRSVEGKSFVNADSTDIEFHSVLSNSVKIRARFKLKDMVFEGKLEY